MSTFDRIVSAGKSFACGLYRNQPGALVPNPISDVLRVVWDDLCGDDPDGLPPPPVSQFQGGQCVCVRYEVAVEVFFAPANRWDFLQPTNWWGPIGGIRFEYAPETGDAVYINSRGSVNGPCQEQNAWFPYWVNGAGTTPGRTAARSGNISRLAGVPDNCGNPPAQYPSTPPPPPDGYTSPPTSITYNDGDDFTAIFNLKPPGGGDAPPPPDICLSVIVTGVELNLCFPFGLYIIHISENSIEY